MRYPEEAVKWFLKEDEEGFTAKLELGALRFAFPVSFCPLLQSISSRAATFKLKGVQ